MEGMRGVGRGGGHCIVALSIGGNPVLVVRLIIDLDIKDPTPVSIDECPRRRFRIRQAGIVRLDQVKLAHFQQSLIHAMRIHHPVDDHVRSPIQRDQVIEWIGASPFISQANQLPAYIVRILA